MEFRLLEGERIEGGAWHCRLERDGLELPATVCGNLAADAASIDGDLACDEIHKCREATADQADGLSQGPGFLVLCGQVSRVFADGACDLKVGEDIVMLDADELQGHRPIVDQRLSLAFKQLVIVLD